MTAVDTFNVCSAYGLRVSTRRRAVQTGASQGFVQRKTLWPEGDLRTFTLVLSPINAAEVARLRQLWTTTRGGVLSMTYTPPDDTATEVRFADRALRFQSINGEFSSCTVRLEEIR